MNAAAFALRHQKTAAFIVAVLTMLGVWAYVTTPAAIFPDMSFSKIDVVADAGDLPPGQIRSAVTAPFERAFLGLPAVTNVRATSSQGSSEIVVTFDPNTDVRFDLQYVDQAISQVRAALPADANVQTVAINPNTEPVVSYAFVAAGLSQTVLRELAQQSLVPQFYGVPGLARVLLAGGPEREYHVALDPAALSRYGLTPGSVSQAIADSVAISAVGVRQRYYQRSVIVIDARVRDAASIARIALPSAHGTPVTIGDLGTVSLGVAPETTAVSYDARPAVVMNFFALPGADAVKLARELKQRMDGVKRRLPSGVHAYRYWDQTDLVVESQKSLRDAISIGAVLAVLVILVFLRNLRMTLVAAIVIPIAMAISVFALNREGQTLNLMSVGGLAVAVGLIIDDTIVVVENIARNMQRFPELPKSQVVVLAMSELTAPMTASTLTTVVVFVPLLMLGGVSGFFFRALALTLGSALVVSLALALFATPALATWLVKQDEDGRGHGGFLERALARYEPVLRWSLSHRARVYAASAVVLVLTLLLLSRLPSDFLPRLDEGQFEVAYSMPVGTTLQAADAAATTMERIALADPAVLSVGRFTGVDTNGYSPTQPRAGTMRVRLRPAGARPSYEVVSDRLRDAFASAVPAAQLDFHQILEDMVDDMSGSRSPVEITLQGPDQKTLADAATLLAARIASVPGIADAFSGVTYDDPALRVDPNGARLASLNVSASDLGSALQASAQGGVAAQVPGTANQIPVRVSLTNPSADLRGALLATTSGAVALGTLARLSASRLSTDISENNGQRVMQVTANYSGSLSAAIAGVRAKMRAAPLPPGYTASIGGAYEAQQASFKEFLTVIAIAVALVYFVMLATFRSYRLPLVILTAIPLALVGVAAALFLTRTPFNVSSFMGLLLLVGLIVKNGILLVDVANRKRHEGTGVEEALVEAGRTRLRPIVMTTFAAIGGLLPLAMGVGAGSAMEQPLAIAVIGGLSTATAFTLVVIPVLYAGIARRVAA